MRIGIIQPNYIPWRGYFDFIKEVDTFVFLDDVQYTHRDWRNRNRIKMADGSVAWLSVPVIGASCDLIMDVRIDYSKNWTKKHVASIQHGYSRSPYFKKYFPDIVEIYEQRFSFLADLDIAFIHKLCEWTGISTDLIRSSKLAKEGSKDLKLIEIMKSLGGTTYLSGPAAKSYIQPGLWSDAGIELQFKDYSGYPAYPQISEPFEPLVSILDLIFMVGPNAPDYIWGKYRNRSSVASDT